MARLSAASRGRRANRPETGVVALAMASLTETIGRTGCEPALIYDRVGLFPDQVADPMHSVPLARYCDLLEHAAARTGDMAFGLRAGAAFGLEDFGPLGAVMAHAPTLGVALRKLCQYFDIYQDGTRVRLAREGARLRLEYEILDPRITKRQQDAELTLALFANVFRHMRTAGQPFAEIHFQHSGAGDVGAHAALFDAPILFGQVTNALVFDAALIAGAMADPDPLAMSRVESDLAARRPGAAASAFEAALRAAVSGCFETGGARVDRVARAMDLSRDRLMRRMARRGIDFNALVADLRRERALLLLSKPDVKLTDIAMSLGYSEHSAFTRAFRGWTGMSPRRYRDLPHMGVR